MRVEVKRLDESTAWIKLVMCCDNCTRDLCDKKKESGICDQFGLNFELVAMAVMKAFGLCCRNCAHADLENCECRLSFQSGERMPMFQGEACDFNFRPKTENTDE